MTAIPHLGFIVAAYAVTVLVLAATVTVLVFDHAAQRRQLARLGEAGRERS